jgi:thioesterase domain-containing protein
VSPRELETYLHEHIPLSKAMAVSVAEASSERVVLRAPLAPNINHRGTVFGGSASAVAMLACWALLHLRLTRAGLASRIVLQRNSVSYARPITADFSATAALQSPAAWASFTRALERKRRARLAVSALLEHAGEVACRFEGEFVAVVGSSP